MKRLFALFAMLLMLLASCLVSCSSTQKITVKQEQEGQIQETVIESDTHVNSFSMVISSDRIEYNGSVYRPQVRACEKPHKVCEESESGEVIREQSRC